MSLATTPYSGPERSVKYMAEKKWDLERLLEQLQRQDCADKAILPIDCDP